MGEVRYTFTASGHESVVAAFGSIRDAAERTARSVAAASSKSAAAQTAAARKAAATTVSTTRKQGAVAGADVSKRIAAINRVAAAENRALAKSLRSFSRAEKAKTDIVKREGARRLAQEQANNERSKSSAAGGAKKRGGKFISRVGRSVASFAAVSAGLAVFGGGARAIRESTELSDLSRDIARRGRTPGKGRLDSRELSRGFRQTGIETGAKGIDVARGVAAFVERTGDVDAALASSKGLSEIAVATGSDPEDIAKAAGALFKNMNIDVKDLAKTMAIFTLQGKAGAFELKDMAKGINAFSAGARILGVKGNVDQAAIFGALAQNAITAAKSAPQAATALEATFGILSKKRKPIKDRYGIDVREVAKQDLAAVLPTLFHKIKGDEDAFENIFDKRSKTGAIDLFLKFKQLEKELGSTEAAMKEQTKQIREQASAKNALALVQEDLASAQQDTGNRLTNVWERVLQSFETGEGAKAVESLVGELPKLLPAIAPMVSAFVAAAKGVGIFISALKSIPGVKKFFKETGDQKVSRLTSELATADFEASVLSDQAVKEAKSGNVKSKYGSISLTTGDALTRVNRERQAAADALKAAKAEAAAPAGPKIDPTTGRQVASEEFVDDATLTAQGIFGAVGGAIGGKPGLAAGVGIGTILGRPLALASQDQANDAIDKQNSIRQLTGQSPLGSDAPTISGNFNDASSIAASFDAAASDIQGPVAGMLQALGNVVTAGDGLANAISGAASKVNKAPTVNPTQ